MAYNATRNIAQCVFVRALIKSRGNVAFSTWLQNISFESVIQGYHVSSIKIPGRAVYVKSLCANERGTMSMARSLWQCLKSTFEGWEPSNVYLNPVHLFMH